MPPLPSPSQMTPAATSLTAPVVRTLTDKPTGSTLTYHLTPPPYAALQILDIHVPDSQRRKGHGSRLLFQAIADAKKQLAPSAKLRRVWVLAPQKTALPFRSFLTQHGFHHTSTTTGLLKNEDALTYIKSYT